MAHSTTHAQTTAVPARPIEIEVPVFEGGVASELYQRIARRYEAIRPDIRINLYGDPRIADKVRLRVLEGSFPSGTNAAVDYWQLIANGDMQAMNESFDEPNWEGDAKWRDTFQPGMIKEYTVDGKEYGVPMSVSPNVIWYNPEMFERYGWKPPETWEAFFELCETIRAKGIQPLAFQGRFVTYAQPVFASVYYHTTGFPAYRGYRLLEPGSFNCEAAIKAFNVCRQFAMQVQPGAWGMSHTEAQMQFLLGNAAMIPCGAWLKSEMIGKIPEGFRLASFNLPRPRDGIGDPRAINALGGYFMVFSKNENKKEMINFLRYMTSRAVARDMAMDRDVPSAVRGVNKGALSSDMADIASLLENASFNYGNGGDSTFTHFPQMSLFWEDTFMRVLRGRISPQDAARTLENAAASVRARKLDYTKITVRHCGKAIALLAILGLAVAYLMVRLPVFGRRKPKVVVVDEDAPGGSLSWGNLLAFTLPAVLIYAGFSLLPGLRAFLWSGYRWNGLSGTENMIWVGLLHFKRLLLESDSFWVALRNNLFIMFAVPVFVVPIAMFLAVCLNRGVWGSALFRVVFLFPNLIGGVAASLLWMHLYNPNGGLINDLLVRLGFASFEGFAWLSTDNLYYALIPIMVWGACGFNMVLYLAAMQGVPSDLYEAAELEGASPFRQFWTITIPLIWDVLTISIVFMIIAGMKSFELVWLLTSQRPTTATHTIGTRLVQTMLNEFNIGEAAAIGVLLFLLVFIGSALGLRLMKRETIER